MGRYAQAARRGSDYGAIRVVLPIPLLSINEFDATALQWEVEDVVPTQAQLEIFVVSQWETYRTGPWDNQPVEVDTTNDYRVIGLNDSNEPVTQYSNIVHI